MMGFLSFIDVLYIYEPQIKSPLTLNRLHCQDGVLSQAFQGNWLTWVLKSLIILQLIFLWRCLILNVVDLL